MGVPATAPVQQPLDSHTWDKNGVLVVATDLQQTLWNTIGEFDWALADLYAFTNGVLGTGLQLSNANSGMTVNIGLGRARALGALKVVQLVTPGILGQPAAFSATLLNGAAIPAGQSRIDVIALQYDWATYTDGNAENHTVDETVIQIIRGTAAVSPTVPALPDNSYVQLGTVTVPTGATTIAQCTIDNTKRNSYQDLGSLSASVPTGTILEYDGTAAPNSYFYLLGPTGGPFGDGTYDPSVDTALAAVVGNRHGTKNGRNLLPDKTGRSGVGPDAAGTTIGSVLALGNTLGAATVALVTANLPAHTHVDSGHVHGTTESTHTHSQNAHTHVDSGHNHVQNAHTHTDSGHGHSVTDTHAHQFDFDTQPGTNLIPQAPKGNLAQYSPPTTGTITGSISVATGSAAISTVTPTNLSGVAANANTTATNNSTATGLSVNSGVANNQNTGSGTAHSNVQPVLCFNYIIRR